MGVKPYTVAHFTFYGNFVIQTPLPGLCP